MSAYDEEFRDRLAGKTIHENPYATFTQENSDWREGWEDQNYHLNTRHEALKGIGWFGCSPSLKIKSRFFRRPKWLGLKLMTTT